MNISWDRAILNLKVCDSHTKAGQVENLFPPLSFLVPAVAAGLEPLTLVGRGKWSTTVLKPPLSKDS